LLIIIVDMYVLLTLRTLVSLQNQAYASTKAKR